MSQSPGKQGYRLGIMFHHIDPALSAEGYVADCREPRLAEILDAVSDGRMTIEEGRSRALAFERTKRLLGTPIGTAH